MVRFKNRYLVVEVNPSDNKPIRNLTFSLKPGALHSAVVNKVQQLHGDFGVAAIRSGFTAKYCNEHTRIAFIRVRHGPHRLVASSLPFITTIGNISATVRSLYTGATLLQCSKFVLRYQRQQLDVMWGQCRTDEERRKMEAAFMAPKNMDDMDYKDVNEERTSKDGE